MAILITRIKKLTPSGWVHYGRPQNLWRRQRIGLALKRALWRHQVITNVTYPGGGIKLSGLKSVKLGITHPRRLSDDEQLKIGKLIDDFLRRQKIDANVQVKT